MNQDTGNRFASRVLLRQSIESVRLVIALFTIASAVTKVLYDKFLPTLTDYDEARWAIIGLGALFYCFTYLKIKRRKLVAVFGLFLYVSTLLYVIAYVLVNRFDPNAVTLLILVLGASSVIINSLFYYAVQSAIIIMISITAYASSALDSENMVAFLNLMIAIGVFGIVMTIRLNLIASVKNSYTNLEKLNILSIIANKKGEIVFISPSVESLLGYKPKELIRDGWWDNKNLHDAWINRDYILNYPNILPKEIELMETSLVNKDGRHVWLNWANSILPNGNYMGVALDITKYKVKEGVR